MWTAMWCQYVSISNMKKVLAIMVSMMFALALPMQASSKSGDGKDDEGGMNLQEIIFEHLGDAYGWEVPFSHEHRIPLPVIVNDNRGGKVVQVAADGKEFRPVDLSITKDVAALIVAALIVLSVMLSLVRYYKRNGMKAPRKGMGAVEALIGFIYDGVLKNTLGEKAPKFAGFLLTAFFFIFTMNLLGLAVIFPGGANLTGNIAVTLVLAVCTFVVTNIKGNKHYWKDIFWPDVPLALKFPLPIMPVIELFGIFTKPAALCVRLFANMMGGHMIVIVLTLLIFIFAPFGAGVTTAATAVSVFFSLFMLLLDVLVSFIQAFVFTMLSTLFISLAVAEPEHHDKKEVEAA